MAGADRTDTSGETDASKRQLLVMLRLPPPHFRPDANYLGSYDTQFGRGARQRVADELAARFKLRIVGSWPMPLLGVDCFVMEAENATIDPVVDEVVRDARVESIQSMTVFHTLSQDDPLYPLQPTQKLWHLDELHQVATGRNVRV